MKWLDIKQEILVELEKSNTTDKEFITKFLKLNRLVNTCRNMLINGTKWETINYSKPFNEADDLVDDLNDNYTEMLKHHQTVNGYSTVLNLGDMLC